jgi:hypothetical protein
VVLACPIPAVAQEHLVPRQTIQSRLNAAAAQHAASIVVLESILDTPEAEKVCRASGISVARLKRQLPILSDEELRDLARRTGDLGTDPLAGISTGGKVVIIVGVLLVILVIVAVVATHEVVDVLTAR